MATPTPPAGGTPSTTSLGDPLLDQGVKVLKDLFKVELDLGTFAGLTDPGIDKLAKSAAVATKKWLKPGNPLLHPLMNYGLGMLSGRIDKAADNQPEPLKTLMRKVSDFLDSYRGELFGKESGKTFELDKEGESVLRALQPVLTKHYDVVLGDGVRLFLEAKAGQMPDLRKYIAGRVLAVREMVDLLLNGPPKQEEPKVPFRERIADAVGVMDEGINAALAPVNQELGQGIAKWKAYNQALKQKAQARGPQKSSLLGRAWKWLAKP